MRVTSPRSIHSGCSRADNAERWQGFTASTIDLERFGYTQSAYFFEGAATSYKVAGGAAADGKWTLEENAHAGPQYRIIPRGASLDRWTRDGTEPPRGTPLEADSSG